MRLRVRQDLFVKSLEYAMGHRTEVFKSNVPATLANYPRLEMSEVDSRLKPRRLANQSGSKQCWHCGTRRVRASALETVECSRPRSALGNRLQRLHCNGLHLLQRP